VLDLLFLKTHRKNKFAEILKNLTRYRSKNKFGGSSK